MNANTPHLCSLPEVVEAKDNLYKIKALGEMLFEIGGNKLELSPDTLTSIGLMIGDLAADALSELDKSASEKNAA